MSVRTLQPTFRALCRWGNSIPSAHNRCSIYKLKFIVCSVAECCSSSRNYSRCLHIADVTTSCPTCTKPPVVCRNYSSMNSLPNKRATSYFFVVGDLPKNNVMSLTPVSTELRVENCAMSPTSLS